jgi:hypothetical protein
VICPVKKFGSEVTILIPMTVLPHLTVPYSNTYFQEGEDKRVCKLKPLVPEMSEEDVRKAVEPLVSVISVADPGCLSRIQEQHQKWRGEIFFVLPFFQPTNFIKL